MVIRRVVLRVSKVLAVGRNELRANYVCSGQALGGINARSVKKLERAQAQRPSGVSIAVSDVFPFDFSDGRCRRLRGQDRLGGMDWARILAYVTGTVDKEPLARNECLAAKNRIMKSH